MKAGFDELIHSFVYMPLGMIFYVAYRVMVNKPVVYRTLIASGVFSVPVGYAVDQSSYTSLAYIACALSGAFVTLVLVGVGKLFQAWADDPREFIKELRNVNRKEP